MRARFLLGAAVIPALVLGACDDTVIGGIGASSGTPDEDIACAQAGIDHFLAQTG